MRIRLSCFPIAMCLTILPQAAFGSTYTVVPNFGVTTEGNTSSRYVFDIGDLGYTSMRFQQVYQSSQFAAFGVGMYITEVAFRPDRTNGRAFAATTLPTFLMTLSTTSKGPDNLSATFANNVGADVKTVYNDPLTISSSNTPVIPGGPKLFDIVIQLETAFFYKPSMGNLLMDITTVNSARTTAFDAHNNSADAISELYDKNSGMPIGIANTVGFVTRFTADTVVNDTVTIPEPGTWLLLISGAGLLTIAHSRRKRA